MRICGDQLADVSLRASFACRRDTRVPGLRRKLMEELPGHRSMCLFFSFVFLSLFSQGKDLADKDRANKFKLCLGVDVTVEFFFPGAGLKNDNLLWSGPAKARGKKGLLLNVAAGLVPEILDTATYTS